MPKNSDIDMEKISKEVAHILATDRSGHGMEHVNRVLILATKFAKKENADIEIVQLAALLHDLDDYKLFGQKHAEKLINANKILNNHVPNKHTRLAVLDIITSMGYSKYLEGIRPKTIEGMIISDADMCDAIGAIGILRTHAYTLSKGNEFFYPSILPQNKFLSASEYRDSKRSHSTQHFFDKLLLIPSILMTESGKEEGEKRYSIMIDFLRHLFIEENSKLWTEHLNKFENKSS